MSEQKSARRVPKQARSQQRVDHVLDTAAALFAEAGYESATTNAIAARAGISIGSLYQFFPNKEAILEALVERYVTDLRTVLDNALSSEANAGRTFSDMIEGMIQQMAAFEASHQAFGVIFVSPEGSIKDSAATTQMHEEIVARVEAFIAERFPMLEAERARIAAAVGVAMFKGMMPLMGSPDMLAPAVVFSELKRAITGYLRAVLVTEGIELPVDLV